LTKIVFTSAAFDSLDRLGRKGAVDRRAVVAALEALDGLPRRDLDRRAPVIDRVSGIREMEAAGLRFLAIDPEDGTDRFVIVAALPARLERGSLEEAKALLYFAVEREATAA